MSAAAGAAAASAPSHGAGKVKKRNSLAAYETHLTLLPHEGRCSIAWWKNGKRMLVHKDTLEAVSLPEGDHNWTLVYDSDGFGALVDLRENHDPIVLENFLERRLCVAEDGTLVVHEPKARLKVWSLSNKKVSHSRIQVAVFVGPTKAKQSVNAAFLQWPRQDCRIFWSALSLYALMKLQSYNNVASKWAWTGAKGWKEFVQRYGFDPDGHIMSSTQSIKEKNELSHDCFLAFPSLSTVAMVALLARWCSCAPQQGGLRDTGGRASAKCLLDGILAGIGNRPFEIEVALQEDWSSPAPHQPPPQPHFTLVVDGDGIVSAAGWQRAIDEGYGIACHWWSSCGRVEAGLGNLSISQLLCNAISDVSCKSLASQLVLQLSLKVELCVALSLKRPPPGKFDLHAKVHSIMDIFDQGDKLNFELVQYNFAGLQATEGVNFISVACDKGNVGGLSLSGAVFGLANNKAIVACPQVMGTLGKSAEALKSGKNKLGATLAINKRHVTWLEKRLASDGEKVGWRARKVHRTAAKKWVKALDNQLRHSTSWQGLKEVQYDAEDERWATERWRDWPFLSCTADQGGDGLSGWHSMAYFKELNTGVYWDWAHGAARDLEGALKSVGMWPLVLLLMLVFNLGHGPDKDECQRFAQFQDLMGYVYQYFSPDTCLLYQHYASRMLDELKSRVSIDIGQRPIDALWSFLQEKTLFPKLGHRIKLCQFMGHHRAARDLLPVWTETLFKAELLCLEMDYFGSKAFREQIILPKAVLDQATALRSTSNNICQIDTKILRSCAQNAVVIAAVTLQSPAHRRSTAMMVFLGEPLNRWHGQAAKQCKSAEQNSLFLQNQMDGGLMKVCDECFDVMYDHEAMQECGFLAFDKCPPEEINGNAFVDEAMAKRMGALCMEIVAHRCRRTLYFLASWPGRTIELLFDDRAQNCIDEFQADRTSYLWASDLESKPRALKDALDRSVFRMVANLQWEAGFNESEWSPSLALKSLAVERSRGICGSLIIEDMLNHQKNSGQIKGSKRMRRPEKSMAVSIGMGLVNERHKYEALESQMVVGRKKSRLGKSAFGIGMEKPTISLSGIESTTQQAPYFSPNPENIGKPAADLPLFRMCCYLENAEWFTKTIFGCMSHPQHMFIFKKPEEGDDGETFDWHFGLGHYPGSSIIAWPLDLKPLKGARGNKQEVVFRRGLKRPAVLPIVTWDGIRAMPVAWRAWAWQVAEIPNAKKALAPAVRLMASGPEVDLLHLAAESAFWNLGITTLHSLSGHLQLPVDGAANLFDTVFGMCQSVLGGDDDATLSVVSKRLGLMQEDAADDISDELFQIDEAAKSLEKNDERAVDSMQKQVLTRQAALDMFSTSYRERKAKVKKEAPPPKKQKTAKAKAAKDAPPPAPERLPENGRIPQGEAKKYLPPGAYVWQARNERAWKTRMKPFNEVSRSWVRHGHEESLFLVVQDAWRKWCILEGVEECECPMGGVVGGSSSSNSLA